MMVLVHNSLLYNVNIGVIFFIGHSLVQETESTLGILIRN